MVGTIRGQDQSVKTAPHSHATTAKGGRQGDGGDDSHACQQAAALHAVVGRTTVDIQRATAASDVGEPYCTSRG